ncbi:MAG: hypothetical protein WDO70_06660 [Alphaproteobacteria bacterium]
MSHGERVLARLQDFAPATETSDILHEARSGVVASLREVGKMNADLTVMDKIFGKVTETIDGLPVEARIQWNTAFMNICAEYSELYTKGGQAEEKHCEGLRKVVDGKTIRLADPHTGKKRGIFNPYYVNWRAAADLAYGHAGLFGVRLHNDIFAEEDIRARFRMAQQAHAATKDFVGNVLLSPSEIRGLIVPHPDRDSIAFGYLVPRKGPVVKFV